MEHDDLALRSDLTARGWTDSELRRLRRAGVLSRVRRGAYRRCGVGDPETPAARHLLLSRATVPQVAPGWVLSHGSAAVVHGLPTWGVPLERVHLSRDGHGGARVTRGVHRHVVPLTPAETVTVDGLRVTSVARTVADLARSLPFEQAVVVADAALAMRATTPAELRTALSRSASWRGGPAARRALDFADAAAGSPGESRSRVAIASAGLPPPVLQLEILDADGRSLGFVDFGWPELGTVGEFDGRVKYGRLLRPGQSPGDAVYAEKVREDAIRDTGPRMVRWTWPDLDTFDPVARRLRRSFTA